MRVLQWRSVCRPRRIVLERHGDSDRRDTDSNHISDGRIRLNDARTAQARRCRELIRLQVVASKPGGDSDDDWRVLFYVSPYQRTLSTLKELGRPFEKREIEGVREESRIREQDLGNFQAQEQMQAVRDIRERFGRFFHRFPESELVADVFDRVTSTSLNSHIMNPNRSTIVEQVSCRVFVAHSHCLTKQKLEVTVTLSMMATMVIMLMSVMRFPNQAMHKHLWTCLTWKLRIQTSHV